MNQIREINSCEICGNASLSTALDLGCHPLCDDLIPVNSNQQSKRYPIEILFCEVCGTAHQRYQVEKKTLFPETYHYRSRHTADVLFGMEQLVRKVEKILGTLKGKTIVDIGCNDGSLLSEFSKYGAITIGVEPTGAAKDAINKGFTVYNNFFDNSTSSSIVSNHGKPDVITFTNVFAHIENIKELMDSLKILCGKNTVVVIENHYMGAILEKNQFDTFYHEHPRTYSFKSFQHIAAAMGMGIHTVEFTKRYGGNIRVFLAPEQIIGDEFSEAHHEIITREESFGQRLKMMQSKILSWQRKKHKEIKEAVDMAGPLPAKAFPGRAAIAIELLKIDVESISGVYEKASSAKIGHYIPGTRIPIISDENMSKGTMGKPFLINFAWHIAPEIHSYVRSAGYKGKIIDIVAPEDFEEVE